MADGMSGVSSFDDSDTDAPNLHPGRNGPRGSSGYTASPSTSNGQQRTNNKNNSSRDEQIIKMLKSLEEKVDERMTRMEEKVDALSAKPQRKKNKSLPLSDVVHRGYASGIAKGLTWQYSKGMSYADPANMEMTTHIKTAVIGQVNDAPHLDITVATRRYFRSKSDESRRDNDKHRKGSLMYQRRFQKAKRRRGVIDKKTSFSDEKKAKANAAMWQQFMSDEDEEEGMMVVRPLEWESPELKKMKKSLDKEYKKNANKKSITQIRERRRGELSARPAPTVSPNLSWILQ